MGRHKGYERDEVLVRAMNAFWSDGFHATSTRVLADAMGINVATLYAEFGSKEGLYAAALDLYERQVVAALFGPLEVPEASLATVRATVRQFPVMARRIADPPGCLVTNAVIDRAPSALASQEAMARYVERVSRGIRHAMLNEQKVSRLDKRAAGRFSLHLVALLIGLFVMARAQVDPKVLTDAAESAALQIDEFTEKHGIRNATPG